MSTSCPKVLGRISKKVHQHKIESKFFGGYCGWFGGVDIKYHNMDDLHPQYRGRWIGGGACVSDFVRTSTHVNVGLGGSVYFTLMFLE